MQASEVTAKPEFVGSDDERQIAGEVFQVMGVMGRFFPKTAPIRVPLTSIVEFIASQRSERTAEEWRPELNRILSQNPDVFAREEIDDNVYFVTTVSGQAPDLNRAADSSHMLSKRFQDPVPVAERPAAAQRRARSEAPAELIEDLPEVPAAAEPVTPAEAGVTPAEGVEAVVEEEPPTTAPAIEEPVDLSSIDPAELAQVVTNELRQDLSVANFGDLWMAEDKAPRLSRGDLRRIKDYLVERNQPLTDETLLMDALGHRRNGEDYDLMRFALNFRLSREHREFEFVGTSDQRFWTTAGLPTIGTAKRKASEIGTDYRFLLQYSGDEGVREEPVVEHVLTFYEYQFGVLPYDAAFASLLPGPLVPDQRAAVLTFESPQTYETLFVELRYPTGNRGGYLAGLEQFFAENLIPGALITIEQTENDGHYIIGYLPISGQDRKLLQLDEKKGRYVFRPTTFYCATQDNMVLSENRFPRLANAAPLDDRTRRRPEETLAATFERVGEQEGFGDSARYMAIVDDLLAAANVERPVSVELIRDLVQSPAYPQFTADPDVEDVFYYQPVIS